MKTNIFIPQTIKVGFRNRDDTYTKKLAYVIYYDQKGILHKETSWNSWRDKNIPDLDFPNIPTSGFVLNKKVGGYSTGWNHRQTYCRVYDERNFEFEITIPNLLYILENTNSIKGKGLEGQFVYGWDGKDILLIPIDSPDYKEIFQYNEIIHSKNYIKTKDLILGATYKTKSNEELIYMGKFDHWEEKYDWDVRGKEEKYSINKGKHHYFVKEATSSWDNKLYLSKIIIKNLGDRFISTVSSNCVENYADLMDKLEHNIEFSPYDFTKDEYIPYTLEEFMEKLTNIRCFRETTIYNLNKEEIKLFTKRNSFNKCYYYEKKLIKNNHLPWYNRDSIEIEKTFEEMFTDLKPMYKNEYLQNNKFYRRVN